MPMSSTCAESCDVGQALTAGRREWRLSAAGDQMKVDRRAPAGQGIRADVTSHHEAILAAGPDGGKCPIMYIMSFQIGLPLPACVEFVR